MYNSYFEEQIRKRGFKYFKEGRVTNLEEKDNIVTAVVNGENPYNVEVCFDRSNDRIIEYAICNCPYAVDSNKYCKHMYATVLEVKYDEKIDKEENLKEKKDNEKAIKQVKIECVKYIKMSKKLFKQIKRTLVSNHLYLTNYDYKTYKKYYKSHMKFFKSHIDLLHGESKYISYYKKRLEDFKILYETLKEDLQYLNKKIQEGKTQLTQVKRENTNTETFGIIKSLWGVVKALMPEEPKEAEGLKIGDHVHVEPYSADGEITDIYKDGDNYKYGVIFEAEHEINGDDEDEDIFFRDELTKID